jgi:2-C-methyl-D-erythritol 4-phosphate cytidylyltransferase
MMNVSATHCNSCAHAQHTLASVTNSKENTSPQERVAAKDQPQAITTTKLNDAYNEYLRTGKLDARA